MLDFFVLNVLNNLKAWIGEWYMVYGMDGAGKGM